MGPPFPSFLPSFLLSVSYYASFSYVHCTTACYCLPPPDIYNLSARQEREREREREREIVLLLLISRRIVVVSPTARLRDRGRARAWLESSVGATEARIIRSSNVLASLMLVSVHPVQSSGSSRLSRLIWPPCPIYPPSGGRIRFPQHRRSN